MLVQAYVAINLQNPFENLRNLCESCPEGKECQKVESLRLWASPFFLLPWRVSWWLLVLVQVWA